MQFCNKYRYTFAIIIGSIYISGSFIVFSLLVYSYCESSKEDSHDFPTGASVTSLLAAMISSLFVFAVVKRHHKLILPWLLLCGALILGTCLLTFILYLAAGWANAPNNALFILLLIGVCIIAIEIAIFWFSCCLYREIRKNNLEHLTKTPVDSQTNESSNLTNLPEKSSV